MPRRSRGCQACRQRRIGCDGTLPSCRQCLITNRQCSGPVQDALIIDQTKAITTRYKQASAPVNQRSTAIVRQPSPKAVVSLAYVSEFMTFLTPTTEGPVGRPWLDGLQDISLDQRGPALDISLDAAATVFCGISAKNDIAINEACRLYGKALSRLSTAILKGPRMPSLATICTSVILSLFETIWSTNNLAYATHLMAARKMISMADLELAQNRLVRDLGVYIQCQTLFTMIIAPNAYLTARENASWDNMARYPMQWMTNTSDRLYTQLFLLGELFVQKDRVSDQTAFNMNEIKAGLDAIWLDYRTDAALRGESIPSDLADEIHYQEALTAMTVAYFVAARVLWHLVHPSELQDLRRSIEKYGQVILNCSLFLATQHLSCASLRMTFPLSLVALHSTSLKQRGEAHMFLDSWLRVTPFTGVCGLIDQRVRFGPV